MNSIVESSDVIRKEKLEGPSLETYTDQDIVRILHLSRLGKAECGARGNKSRGRQMCQSGFNQEAESHSNSNGKCLI